MTELSSAINVDSEEFTANSEAMARLLVELEEKRAEAARGGSQRARKRHTDRGKLLPRERVMKLIDPGSPFLELSALAANDMYE
ncbi:MAG: methylcrotonoyl-CoA carboxylase, partial [Methyloligellaceae bacterium]